MVKLAVNGTLMRGLELNKNMLQNGATFIQEDATAPVYRLYSMDDAYPGMVHIPANGKGGESIALELWEVPAEGVAAILGAEPPGLSIGKVTLASGEAVLGVLAEAYAVEGKKEITSYKGWRAYKAHAASNGVEKALAPALELRVKGEPYDWPYNGKLLPTNTVFLIIDMQTDFCGKGGYVEQMGYDLALTQAPIEPIKKVLRTCRELGYHVMHTREGHRPDLADLPANKRWRSEKIGAGIGSSGPAGRILVRGEKGWDIIPELYPIEGEPIIEKPGKGSFYATDLQMLLHLRGIENIVLAGITTDVCVHTTMRDANDRGYECLILSDCTGATDHNNHLAALNMVKMQGGVFGSVSDSESFISTIKARAA
eukprot:TRINITY_DN36169_c0_g1_i1.p1 TRINITY_DN36169_c0_g1~~TRINITY_DN36169_c0_g1_i1.p1  ORF type:complete len:370 (-),score=69.35 TRINITY_DN36169_c0_g1_i1:1370-2479(-)